VRGREAANKQGMAVVADLLPLPRLRLLFFFAVAVAAAVFADA